MKASDIVAVTLASVVIGCGGGEAPTAAPTPTATAPAAAAPAQPPTPAARGPIGTCSLGASVRVARERRRPKIVVGRNHVAVVHQSRRPPSIDGNTCDAARAVQTSPLPLTDTSFGASPTDSPCVTVDFGDGPELAWAPIATVFVDAERDGGDVYTIRCDAVNAGTEEMDSNDAATGCRISAVGGSGIEGTIPIAAAFEDFARVRTGFQVSRASGTTVFAVAIANTAESDGVYALLAKDGRTSVTRRLGRPPTAVDLDDATAFVMTATPSADGGFVFEHGAASTTRRVRTVFGPADAPPGAPTPTTIEAPAPPEVDLVTDRSQRNAPSVIRLHRRGVASPIGGFPAEVATFAPRFVARDGRLVAVWSEGTGTTTRIRAAIVDVATSAIVGPIVDVSAAGIEAGYATIDAFEDTIVVAWDEKKPDGWDVRAATLSCR